MPKVKINPMLDKFKEGVSSSQSLADDANTFKEPKGGKDRPILKSKKYLIVELSFLKLYLAWEQFLEETFTRFMCGSITASGYSPNRFVQPPTLKHAYSMVLEGKSFVDWTKISNIIRRARMFFEEGEPYVTAVGSASSELEEMRRIRNRIAHRSEHSVRLFKEVVRQRIGSIPKGMRPGRFLLYIDPNTNQSFLEEYSTLLLAIAQNIVR